jgi:hypothetical protein
MPTFKFTGPDGKQYTVNGPDGATEQQAFQMLQAQLAPPKPATKPFGQQLNDLVSDLPRQVGLTGRYALEGVGDALDFVATPIRAGLNAVGIPSQPGTGRALANTIGLPEPRNAQERMVGDATRMLAGAAVPIGVAGRVAQGAGGATKAVAQQLASNPLQQLASAGAAGAAGGYTRETGGNAGSQLLASLAAGVAVPAAMGAGQRIGAAARQMVNRPAPTPAQIDIQITRALGGSGLDLTQIGPEVHAAVRNDVAQALKVSDDLDPEALRRLVDYRMTGLTPTVGKLTRDPATFTQEENLMRVGANSKDKAAQQLGSIKNTNNNKLIDLMNSSGAATSDDAIGGANKIMGALQSRDARAQSIIGRLYDRARDSSGRSAPLDPSAFTQRAGDLLHEANVESFLTPDIRNKLNGFASGKIPLTVEIAEQFKTGIGRLQRNSTDGNVRHALGLVRQALDEAPLVGAQPAGAVGSNQLMAGGQLANAQAAGVGQEAIDAFNRARRVNRLYMQTVEDTPALAAVRDGVEPDKFVQQFIIGNGAKASVAGVDSLYQQIKGNPEAMGAVKGQMARYLKSEALNGARDEVGNFSQSGFNDALSRIGERKLRMFFSPDEVDQLKAIGRVGSYEQVAPAGAFPNRSNTAGAISGILDRIIGSSVLSKIPAGRMLLQEPIENIVIGQKAQNALTVPRALQTGPRAANPLLPAGQGLMLSPALLMGGPDDKKR